MSKKAGVTSRCAATQRQTDNALRNVVVISARSFSRMEIPAHDLYVRMQSHRSSGAKESLRSVTGNAPRLAARAKAQAQQRERQPFQLIHFARGERSAVRPIQSAMGKGAKWRGRGTRGEGEGEGEIFGAWALQSTTTQKWRMSNPMNILEHTPKSSLSSKASSSHSLAFTVPKVSREEFHHQGGWGWTNGRMGEWANGRWANGDGRRAMGELAMGE